MLKTRSAITMFSVGLVFFGINAVCAQNFPTKPLRIITTATGGSGDIMSRLIAQGLYETWGQPVIVDNRGNIGGEFLAKAAPDGYTMMLDGLGLWLGTLLQKLPYDPVSFAPITIITRAPNILVVHPSVQAKSVKELIALAKSKPGALNYGGGGIGGVTHLAAELFKSMAGVNVVLVNYAGTGQATNAVVAGEVQMMMVNPAQVMTFLKAGKVRALGVGTPQPSPLVPDVPSISAAGVPGFESIVYIGMVAAAQTPAATTSQLNREIVRVLNKPDVKEKLAAMGTEVVGNTPQEMADRLKNEMTRWAKVIKDQGITLQ